MDSGTMKFREQSKVLLKLLSYYYRSVKDSLLCRANNILFHTTSNK